MFGGKQIVRTFAITVIAIVVAQSCFGQLPGAPKKPTGPWMDKSLTPDQRAELVLKEMTLDEKIQLVHGTGLPGFGPTDPSIVRSNGGGGFVPGIMRLGLPDLNMNDGSLGSGGGAQKGRYSTAMPSFPPSPPPGTPRWPMISARSVGREDADQGYNISLGGGVRPASKFEIPAAAQDKKSLNFT